MSGSTPRRGLDGLTTDELAASRRGWWDEAFSDVLLRRVPRDARELVDVGCGIGTAAHALLPERPATSYLGIDADADRIVAAEKLMAAAPYRDRTRFLVARAQNLPFRGGEVDVVLTSMTLQHVADPAAVIGDVHRVLRRSGTLLVVEPDQTGTRIYFDGLLGDVTAADRALMETLRRHRRPADIAIGPALGALAERAGFQVEELFPYVVGKAKKMLAREFFSRAGEGVNVIAAMLPPDAPDVRACRAALAAAEAAIGPDTTGYGCSFVPVFVCTARKV